jgi:hypothetical protein
MSLDVSVGCAAAGDLGGAEVYGQKVGLRAARTHDATTVASTAGERKTTASLGSRIRLDCSFITEDIYQQ